MNSETGNDAPQAPEGEDADWKKIFSSLRRPGEVFSKILKLQETVDALKHENALMRGQIETMQRQIDQQDGQLRVLGEFVRMAVDARVEAAAKLTAMKAIETYLAAMNDKAKK
jgi:hypothetical protein